MRNEYLNIALIQADLVWENAEKNLENLNRIIDTISSKPDLIVLPEMFTTGFTMNAETCAEGIDGNGMKWMAKTALKKNCVIAGSLLFKENGKYYNRLIWMRPDGDFEYYDKHHLFSMAGEHKVMTRGDQQKIVSLNGWNICLQICFDLRFPAWSRNQFNNGSYAYDVLLYVSNWPSIRSGAYQALLPARSVENSAYTLWVNRVGTDGNGVNHSGDTMVINQLGKIIKQADSGKQTVLEVQLSCRDLEEFREKFQVGHDWDDFHFQEIK